MADRSALQGTRPDPTAADRDGPSEASRLSISPKTELKSYQTALNRHAIVSHTNRAGRITHVNDLFCEISRYSRDELLGAPHSIVNGGHHPPEFFVDLWRTIASGARWQGEICNRARDGTVYWVDTTIVPVQDEAGVHSGYVSIRSDITERKRVEASLIEEVGRRVSAEALLRDIIETIPNGVSAFDKDDRLILFNSAFRDCYPSAADLIRSGATFAEIMRCALDRGEFPQVGRCDVARRDWLGDGMRRHLEPGRAVIQQLRGDRWLKVQERRSRSGHIVGVRTDVSDLKRAERQIKLQAERDPLTGLPNRRVLLDRLRKALPAGQRAARAGVLMLADLDGFKAVNDTFGHDAGDELLIEVGRRFTEALRRSDLVARLGGDEFAILLPGVRSSSDCERIARKLLACLEQPVRIGRKAVPISASFGIALFPQHGSHSVDVFKHADMALYRAKHGGRSTFALFDASLRREQQQRAATTDALRRAILDDAIQIELQPQRCFRTGAHSGFEALARWSRGGVPVPPSDFIGLAEDAGLIKALGEGVMLRAFDAYRDMLAGGFRPGALALNVSAAELRDPGFAERFLGAARQRGLRCSDLVLEVTEGVVLEKDAAVIGDTLNTLAGSGVSIALDDFGTGYASLLHLKRLPIACLKIDRSFVAGLASRGEDAAIPRTVISLAHALGMKVVAEGIETEEQFGFLLEMSCDIAQGFLIGRPMKVEDAKLYLKAGGEPSSAAALRVA